MNRMYFSICLIAALTFISTHAEDDGTAVLTAVKLGAGTITSMKYDDSPAVTAGDGKVLRNNMPPRLSSRSCSTRPRVNIRVEIWLPDAGKWNGRFVGLGNGGAAGGINSNGLAGWMAGGFAVAPRIWEPRRRLIRVLVIKRYGRTLASAQRI